MNDMFEKKSATYLAHTTLEHQILLIHLGVNLFDRRVRPHFPFRLHHDADESRNYGSPQRFHSRGAMFPPRSACLVVIIQYSAVVHVVPDARTDFMCRALCSIVVKTMCVKCSMAVVHRVRRNTGSNKRLSKSAPSRSRRTYFSTRLKAPR